MHTQKTYCLKCEKINSCSCGTQEFLFTFSDKLRPPKTKNKAKFRKFLMDCPQFVNCVPEELMPRFKELLIKVKHPKNTPINGRKWTIIS